MEEEVTARADSGCFRDSIISGPDAGLPEGEENGQKGEVIDPCLQAAIKTEGRPRDYSELLAAHCSICIFSSFWSIVLVS